MKNVSLCTATTLRASYPDTMSFVYYHLNSGVDHMYLFFDNPEDKAIAELEDEERVTCFRCDDDYWNSAKKFVRRDKSVREFNSKLDVLDLADKQITNANSALRLSRKKGIDWIVHLDSDELIFPINRLYKELCNATKDISEIRFQIREAISSQLSYKSPFSNVNLFKKPASKLKSILAQKIGCSIVFEGQYFRGHTSSKCAVRTSSDIQSMSIHKPYYISTNNKIIISKNVKLFHFDTMGFESWQNKWKWRMDGTAVVPGMRKNRLKQFQRFSALYTSNEKNNSSLESLYKEFNSPTAYQLWILWLLNMTEKSPFKKEMFNFPMSQA